MLEQNNGKKPKKYAGILAHPTSFPSPYGIGDLGPGAYQFIDFLAASGLNLWQVLPDLSAELPPMHGHSV